MSHWRDYLYCKANPSFNQSKCALKPSWLNWSKCQNKDRRTVFTQKTCPSHLCSAKDTFLHCSRSCPIHQEIFPVPSSGLWEMMNTVLSVSFSAASVSPQILCVSVWLSIQWASLPPFLSHRTMNYSYLSLFESKQFCLWSQASSPRISACGVSIPPTDLVSPQV